MLYLCFFIVLALCFLLGMTWLRVGLFNVSGGAVEGLLRKMTNTPISGFIAGIVMTAVLQSSSAVTVIAVGLVSARILAFPQTIGIILGTNIGTTITLEFFTFDLTKIIIPFLAIGLFFMLFKHAKWRSTGFIFVGIGMIFAAMNGFEWLSSPLAQVSYVQHLIYLMRDYVIIAFLTGTLLTALIQSSTVMTGIAMSFLATGIFPLETGIAIMLGANIGTCATGLLAAIGAGHEARLTAFAHMWLNIAGALIFLPLSHILADASRLMTDTPESQLAHASVVFNVLCSLVVLPFANQFGRLISKIHGGKRT
ncbi:Na/Pi symporter [Bacillus sp. FJAT-50079]|uniref:Na/Pi symporter n=1 Tax=Bacillus sp. FJAT-50079 TaxID=2833577 RepID=UPI001BC9F954|nr:Na/Pi symporter [Bacillus sp. FJAT-50079]MBS4209064.1 Na/Pi cotransporter family protein [Bacillus sp. FJAT-50079]